MWQNKVNSSLAGVIQMLKVQAHNCKLMFNWLLEKKAFKFLQACIFVFHKFRNLCVNNKHFIYKSDSGLWGKTVTLGRLLQWMPIVLFLSSLTRDKFHWVNSLHGRCKKRRGRGEGEKCEILSLFPFLPIPSRRLLCRLLSKWRWLYVYRANESSLCFPTTLKKQKLRYWTSLALSVCDKFQLKTKTTHVIHGSFNSL